MTARDQARQWLAETICAAQCGRGTLHDDLADAILDAPGVTVEEIRGVIAISDLTVHPVTTVYPPGLELATHTQTVIRLPAVPLDGPGNRPQSPAAATEGTGETDRTHETAETNSGGRGERCANCGRPIRPKGTSKTGWTHDGDWQGVRCPREITGAIPARDVWTPAQHAGDQYDPDCTCPTCLE